MTSFDFGVAEAAIADRFLPDTISSDFYRRHQGSSPPHDLPRTVSKLIAAGMPERDALAAATARSAEILDLAGEVGTLAAGACADLAVLRWNPDAVPLADAAGNVRSGGCWEPVLTVRAGELVRAQRSGRDGETSQPVEDRTPGVAETPFPLLRHKPGGL
jgi:predicted amidohydrolase